MKIGVISDTHLRASNPYFEKIVDKYFKDVDLILHAGDLTSLDVLDAFKGKEVIAVAGNCDSPEVKQRFPEKKIVTVNHFKIGLRHGWGWPVGLEKRVIRGFEGLHCVVYGHNHQAANHRRNGILFFNPGAFSGGIFSLWRPSVGLLTLDKDIRGKIIRIS